MTRCPAQSTPQSPTRPGGRGERVPILALPEASLREDLAAITAPARGGRAPRRVAASAHPASESSLRTPLELALDRARRLEAENRRLREQLGTALGQRRLDRVTTAGTRIPV